MVNIYDVANAIVNRLETNNNKLKWKDAFPLVVLNHSSKIQKAHTLFKHYSAKKRRRERTMGPRGFKARIWGLHMLLWWYLVKRTGKTTNSVTVSSGAQNKARLVREFEANVESRMNMFRVRPQTNYYLVTGDLKKPPNGNLLLALDRLLARI